MPAESHRLILVANGRCVATLTYEAIADKWSLIYDTSWTASPTAFPLSPALPLRSPLAAYDSRSLQRFIENLLPEGQALDVVATTNRVSKANLLALITALGAETTGALQFVRAEMLPSHSAENRLREVSLKELHRRLEERDAISLTVWDGKARTSQVRHDAGVKTGCPCQRSRHDSFRGSLTFNAFSFPSDTRHTCAISCPHAPAVADGRRSRRRRPWCR